MQAATPSDDTPPQISGKQVDIHGGAFLNAHTINYNGTNGDAEALKHLRSKGTTEALHTSKAVARQNMCTPGTRTDTLDRLRSLARSSDPDSPDVVWMHGPAGAGKSAIMRTLADDLAKDRLLLATFFFFRSDKRRNNSAVFIPTLAAQACDALPATQSYIAQGIQRNHDVFARPAHGQAPILLEEPLVAVAHHTSMQGPWTPTTPLIIIVDGLDECMGTGDDVDVEGQTEIINAMVQLASSIRTRTNRHIKVFIASRPEYHIESAFSKFEPNENTKTVRLTSHDAKIHLFYEQEFDKIRQKFRLPPSWPSKEDVEWLTDKTSGQYSFAGLSTRFLYGGDPKGRLRMIRGGLKDDKLNPFEALDQLYATVLKQVPEDMRTRALLVLRCHLDSKLWMIRSILESFLQLPLGYVQSLRPYLSSLVDFDHDLAPYHASLADFLFDRSRSEQFDLYIDDCTLSHIVQRATLAMLGERDASKPLSNHEEQNVCIFWQGHGQRAMIAPHPLPSIELTLAFKRVDPSSLTIVLSRVLYDFLQLLHKQFRSQHLYITRPLLWYMIMYALPNQIKLNWERRTAPYLACVNQDQTELALGLALAGGAGDIQDSLYTVILPHFNEEFNAIDTSRGWDLREYSKRSTLHFPQSTLSFHLRTSNVDYFWRCVHAALRYVSDHPHTAPIRLHVLTSFHSSGNHTLKPYQFKPIPSDLTVCAECTQYLSEIDYSLLQGIINLINETETPVQPQEAVTLYCFVRNKMWWRAPTLVGKLSNYSQKCLSEFIFLFPSQKRELVKISQALLKKRSDPYSHDGTDETILEKSMFPPQFIVLRRKHWHRHLFVLCSIFACLLALYITL